jgi:hypothetical protein
MLPDIGLFAGRRWIGRFASFAQFTPWCIYSLCLFVPLRVPALPIPQVSAHCLQSLGRFESKLLFCKSRVRRKIRDVTTANNLSLCQMVNINNKDDSNNIPSTNDLVVVVKASYFSHSLKDLENAHAITLAEVVGFVASIIRAIGEDSGLWG